VNFAAIMYRTWCYMLTPYPYNSSGPIQCTRCELKTEHGTSHHWK